MSSSTISQNEEASNQLDALRNRINSLEGEMELLRTQSQLLTTGAQAPLTFMLFSQLPAELRLKIWRHAHDLFPRVIEVIPIDAHGMGHEWDKILVKPSAVPVLLSVCIESRKELLTLYSAPFNPATLATADTSPELNASDLIMCWENDTLFVNSAMSSVIKSRYAGSLRRVAYFRPSVSFDKLFKKVTSKAQLLTLAGDIGFWKDLVFTGTNGSWRSGINDLCSEEFSSLHRVIFVGDQQPPSWQNGTARLQSLRKVNEEFVDPWLQDFRKSLVELEEIAQVWTVPENAEDSAQWSAVRKFWNSFKEY